MRERQGEKEKERDRGRETDRKSVCGLILGHKLISGNSPSNPLDPYWHNFKHTHTHSYLGRPIIPPIRPPR